MNSSSRAVSTCSDRLPWTSCLESKESGWRWLARLWVLCRIRHNRHSVATHLITNGMEIFNTRSSHARYGPYALEPELSSHLLEV